MARSTGVPIADPCLLPTRGSPSQYPASLRTSAFPGTGVNRSHVRDRVLGGQAPALPLPRDPRQTGAFVEQSVAGGAGTSGTSGRRQPGGRRYKKLEKSPATKCDSHNSRRMTESWAPAKHPSQVRACRVGAIEARRSGFRVSCRVNGHAPFCAAVSRTAGVRPMHSRTAQPGANQARRCGPTVPSQGQKGNPL